MSQAANASPVSIGRVALIVQLALAVGAFAFGVGELAIMGLMPNVATGLHITDLQVGHAITAYALGVVVGAPTLAILGASARRKHLLMALVGLSVVANIGSALATGYQSLLLFRFIAGLPHGAYFGVALMVAASMVVPERRATAVSRVVFGITLSMLLGTPMSTWLGQRLGWPFAFGLVALLALVTLALIALCLPAKTEEQRGNPLQELRAINRAQVWAGLAIGALGFIGLFAVLGYIAPVLLYITGVGEHWIPLAMIFFGVGAVLGNLAGGWLFDRLRFRSILWILCWSALVLLVFPLAARYHWSALPGAFLLGTILALAPALQTYVMEIARGAETLAGAFNQAAFNTANALGPLFGGMAIAAGFGWTSPAYIGAASCVAALVICWVSVQGRPSGRTGPSMRRR